MILKFCFLKKTGEAKNASSVERGLKEKQGAAISKTFPLHTLVGLRKPFVDDVNFELHH